jgi:hypothetical protein
VARPGSCLALEQQRYYRAKGIVSFAEQCRQLTEVRAEHEWVRAVGGRVSVLQIRSLADLGRWDPRLEWVKIMQRMRRITLFTCHTCHHHIRSATV